MKSSNITVYNQPDFPSDNTPVRMEDISTNHWLTARELCSSAGLPFSDEQLNYILTTPSWGLKDLKMITALRIISTYVFGANNKEKFALNADLLSNLVMRIDALPKAGYYYETALRQDCKLIVPFPLAEDCTLSEILQPLIVYRENLGRLSCNMIGTALVLLILHQCFNFNPILADYDLSEMVYILCKCPVHSLVEEIFIFLKEVI